MKRLLLATIIVCTAFVNLAGAQPVKTNQGANDAAFSGSVNLTITAGAGDLVEVFSFISGGSGVTTFSACGSVASGDWTVRFGQAGGPNYTALVYAKPVSALSGCTLTISRTAGTASLASYGAWSGTSSAIFDSMFTSAALSTSGAASKPTGVATVTAQAHDIITTWENNPGDTGVDCGIATGGTGSWSTFASRNDINAGGLVSSQLSTTAVQSFTPTNAGVSCNSKAFWSVLIDAITADSVPVGGSSLPVLGVGQ